MFFRFPVLLCIVAICACCTGAFDSDNASRPVGDSISFFLQKGISQPDTLTETAFSYLEKALKLSLQKNPGKYTMFEIYFNLGVLSEKMGNYDLAVSYFDEAINNSDRKKHLAKKGDAFNLKGQISVRQGKYDLAMEYFPKALEIRVHLNDVEGQASSYRNIGTAYQKGGNYEHAEERYKQSLELYRSLKNEMGMADCYNNLGGLWLEQNRPQRALEFYHECEKIFNAVGNSEQLWNVYYNIGSTYHLMYEIRKAREYYSKMLEISHSLSSPTILAETFCTMGAFLDDVQQSDPAITYYGKAIEIANSSNLFEVLQYALEQRSRLYAAKNRYREAYNDLVAYGFAYDAVNNSEMIKAFTQKSMQYEFDMKQKEQEFQNRIQRIFIIALSVVVLLVCAVGILQYRAFVQKKKDHALLKKQHNMLEKQKEEITDSIRYASFIQKATLPAKEYAEAVLPRHFIYYRPRDIVSGDFYWINYVNDSIIVAAADCTGHGVPGAIVSMLGVSTLNKITCKMNITKADLMLNELRDEIIHILNPVGAADRRQDGMDIALAIISQDKHEIEFAGAYNPLYLVRDGELIEKKADRMPIGLHVKQDEKFTATSFEYLPGDTIYMFSDGYADQFGGSDGSKFKSKNFKKLLVDINKYSMEEQADIIEKTHLEWRGKTSQIDDILVIGIRL